MKFIASALLMLMTFSCKSPQVEDSGQRYRGLVKPQGITSYQYGTHTLETDDNFYALKSDTINLDDFLDETVLMEAREIEGYPVDGGPIYLNVTRIIE